MSLRSRRRPTRQERAMRIVRVAQTELPAIYEETDFSKLDEYRKMALEYQDWLRKNPPTWMPGVPQRGWRTYARDVSGDTSRISFIAGLLLGIVIGIVVALAMTVRPRRQQLEQAQPTAIELLPDDEVPEESDDETADSAADETEESEELAGQAASAD